ncbi:MAG: hypothetical protein ACLGH0_02880 [Thermoanaerobaculia bacterium]
METKFRSLPLSLIDFFGVLLPGLAWVLLLATAREMCTTAPDAVTPLDGWRMIRETIVEKEPWFGSASLVLFALAVGYIAKPRAMHLATRFPVQLMSTDAGNAWDRVTDRRFPYRARHADKAYFAEIERLTKELTGCTSDELPGPQPFAIVKRFLRLIAPQLWEEHEHHEAEVRLLGSLFLATFASAILGLIELGRVAIYAQRASPECLAWMFASGLAAIFAADGYGHLPVAKSSTRTCTQSWR